jgi:hypothetical protein
MKKRNHGRSFEFCFPELRVEALVEQSRDGVTLRLTRDIFSEKRKISFIRELAAEGFIPDTYQGFTGADLSPRLKVRWLVDGSWPIRRRKRLQNPDRFMIRLLISAAILWLILMIGAFLH